MAQAFVELPLYEDEDYYYSIALEGNAYTIRYYFNNRMQQWIFDLRFANDDPIILGEALVPDYPILNNYIVPLTGYFLLQSIGDDKNQTIVNPFDLSKYYQLFYIYNEEE